MDVQAYAPVLLSLQAAFLFGLQAVLARRTLRYVNAQTGSMITICTAAVCFWGLYVWRMEWQHWQSPAIWVFASNGLLHPLLSMMLSFEANRRMGATVSATIAATTPLFAAGGALLLLREILTTPLLIGTLGIVLGVAVLTWGGKSTREWRLPALVFPFGASVVRAFNHVWGKFGLNLLPVPLLAATLSFTVSAALALTVYRVRTGKYPLGLPRGGLLWGMSSGLCVTGAILSMYIALSLGSVVVVSPVINTYPLFTLGASLLLREELLRRRIVLGVLLVVAGVVLVGLA